MKDKNGWPVSQCMKCYCKGGLLTCSRHFKINFPGYLSGIYTQYEDCNQPLCNVAKFIRENGNDCEGIMGATISDKSSWHASPHSVVGNPSTHHNKQKSCSSSLISYLQVPLPKLDYLCFFP